MVTLVLSPKGDQLFPLSWVQVDWEAEKVTQGLAEAGSDLADASEGELTKVVLVLPGAQVICRFVDLPVRNDHQLRIGAAYHLEDDLAEAPASYHVALGAPALTADGRSGRLVYLCNLEQLQHELSQLAELGIEPHVVLPDYGLLPPVGDGLSFANLEGQMLVRLPSGEGFSVEPDLAETLIAALAPGVEEREEVRYPELFERAKAADELGAVNLLQGALQPRRDLLAGLLLWRRLAVLGVLALLLGGIGLGLSIRTNTSLANQLEAEAVARYQAAFPDETVNDNLPRLLRAHRGVTVGADFLESVAQLSAALEKVEGAAIESLSFDRTRGELKALIVYPSFEDVDRLTREVQGLGLTFEEGSARQEGDRVYSDLTVRMGP